MLLVVGLGNDMKSGQGLFIQLCQLLLHRTEENHTPCQFRHCHESTQKKNSSSPICRPHFQSTNAQTWSRSATHPGHAITFKWHVLFNFMQNSYFCKAINEEDHSPPLTPNIRRGGASHLSPLPQMKKAGETHKITTENKRLQFVLDFFWHQDWDMELFSFSPCEYFITKGQSDNHKF